MDIAARTGAWMPSGAPLPYDAEVEWIKASGTQYVNTGILPRNGLTISVKVTSGGQNASIFGGGNGWGNKYLQISFGTTGSTKVFYFGYNNYAAFPTSNVNWKNGGTYELKEDDNEFYIDGNYVGFATKGVFSSTYPIYLFCYNRSGVKGEYSKDSIHYFKITENGESIIDLIPVRFTNENGVSEGAMYDRVSGQLFRNAGTGAFIIGPDKVSQLGGGSDRRCVRRSHRRLARPSARFCALASRHSQEWEVAA